MNAAGFPKYYQRREETRSTNWLWIVERDHTKLIGWDNHLKGIEVYSYQKFTGCISLENRNYNVVCPTEVAEVLNKVIEDFESCRPKP